MRDEACFDALIRKMPTPSGKYYQGTGEKPAGRWCKNFNEGRCHRNDCKYSHICSNCQQDHAVKDCPTKARDSSGNANTTPLGNRVTRPEWLPGHPRVPSSLVHVAEGFPYPLFNPANDDLYQGPLRVERWEWWMRQHPDITFQKTLSGILRKGAKIGFLGNIAPHRHQNHRSALDATDILAKDLEKQLKYDRLARVDP